MSYLKMLDNKFVFLAAGLAAGFLVGRMVYNKPAAA